MNGHMVPALLLATTPLLALAAVGDPLDSAQCRAARAELEQALNAPDARLGKHLAQARAKARDICLGRAAATPLRSGAPDPAQVVPPPVLRAPPRVPPPVAAPPPPPVTVPRPAAITACDPAGCWDSEGRRLNQMGPVLMGPRGVCTMQGGIVSCP